MTDQSDLESAVEQIMTARRHVTSERAALIAVSGIDASGKGYLAAKLADAVQVRGLRVANINIDGWLNLPRVRFSETKPAEHFYRNAIRFDEMFGQLIFPLRDRGSLSIEMDYAAETATEYRKQRWAFDNIDVILLEGIYLLKRQFRPYYDLSFWVDCSFETALNRAIARAQEGLAPDQTINAYTTIYFPAQEFHFARDNPRPTATAVINNDPRIICARPK
jgi:uridine kinase